jgi:CubicO group peptidase (beta-lactamase class C family)
MLIFLRTILKAILVIFLIALLILSLPANVNLAHAQTTSNDFSEVDAYINETMLRLPIKGLALAVVKGDQIIYMQGYGIANAQGDPATPQTPWPMGSVTKSFTALAIRQLAVAEKVDLDAPVQTYLPEFQLSDQHAASIITIRDLLDHTSGISKQEGEEPYLNSPTTTYADALDHLAKYRLDYQPGEHGEYSNWNYVLLSQVVSRVSNQPYAEYVQENIFVPLEMSRSTFADFHAVLHVATGDLITFGFPVPYDEKFVPGMVGAGYLLPPVKIWLIISACSWVRDSIRTNRCCLQVGAARMRPCGIGSGAAPHPILSMGFQVVKIASVRPASPIHSRKWVWSFC